MNWTQAAALMVVLMAAMISLSFWWPHEESLVWYQAGFWIAIAMVAITAHMHSTQADSADLEASA